MTENRVNLWLLVPPRKAETLQCIAETSDKYEINGADIYPFPDKITPT